MASCYDALSAPGALEAAWERVSENRGGPGFDGVRVEAFERQREANLAALRTDLRAGTYHPLPLLRGFLHKEDGEARPIAIPAVRDRIVQEALLHLLTPLFEPDFPDCSFAFRPGRSALKALARVEEGIAQGKTWVLHGDIEAFFDRIDHTLLLQALREKLTDAQVLDLIFAFLKCPLVDGMRLEAPQVGTAQGMPISPLLSNLYLLPFDLALTREGYDLVRFVDDFVVLAVSEEICRMALERAREALTQLRLTLHPEKTAVQPVKDGFVFLGYHIDLKGKGPSRKALAALEARLEAAWKECEPLPFPDRLEKLDRIIRGWVNYFGSPAAVHPKTLPVLLSLARMALVRGEEEESRELLSLAEASFPEAASDPDARQELARLQRQVGPGPDEAAPLKSEGPVPSGVEGPVPSLSTGSGSRAELRDQAESLVVSQAEPPATISVEAPVVSPVEPKAAPKKADPYAAISRLRQLLKNQPDYADGYRELAESYAAIGQYGLAKQAYEKALELEPRLADAERERSRIVAMDRAESGAIHFSEAQLDRFLALFSGREGVYARQWVDAQGRRGFSPVGGTLDRQAVGRHLAGAETLGLYLIRKDDTVTLLVLDVDVDKKLLLESAKDRVRLSELEHMTHHDACRIAGLCAKLGVPVSIEDSGYKGRHCWIFFGEPVPARLVRQFAKTIVQQAGPPSGGIHWEIFPNQEKVREGKLGGLIKLPLGVHKKTGRRCLFLDLDDRPLQDQGGFLLSIQVVSPDVLSRIVGLVEEREGGVGTDDLAPPSPAIAAMLKGCNILRYLVQKARETNYLNHGERGTLLYTLGHLGDDGKAYLHRVIGKTINYDYDITEKYIRKMKEYPISCPRIREVHQDLLGAVECQCEFRLPPRGYPSPILYALQAGTRPPRRKAAPEAEGREPEEGARTVEMEEPGPGRAAVLQGLALSQSKGSPQAESAGREDQDLHEPPRETARSAPEVIAEAVNGLLTGYLDLKKRRRALEREIQEQEAKLSALFDQAGVERLATDSGLLRRQREGDHTSWLIEL